MELISPQVTEKSRTQEGGNAGKLLLYLGLALSLAAFTLRNDPSQQSQEAAHYTVTTRSLPALQEWGLLLLKAWCHNVKLHKAPAAVPSAHGALLLPPSFVTIIYTVSHFTQVIKEVDSPSLKVIKTP